MSVRISPVRRVLEDAAGAPLTLAEIASRSGLSQACTEKWLRRLRADGLAWSEALRHGKPGGQPLVWRIGAAPEPPPSAPIPGSASLPAIAEPEPLPEISIPRLRRVR